MGTIGGTLAHGDPASDLPAILLAARGLGDRSAAPSGEREVAAADFFEDYLTTAVAEDEILTEVRLPGAGGLRLRLREVQPPPGGLGDGGRRRALVKKGGDGTLRGRAHRAHPHGLDAAAGDRGRRRPCAASR